MGRRQFGAIRKLPSGRFQARYTDESGGLIAAPKTFETKGDADRWLASIQVDWMRGTHADPRAARLRFDEWAEEWLGFKAGQRPATLARDRAAIRTHFSPEIGQLPMGAITPRHIRQVVQQMQSRGLSAKSVRTYVGTLQAIFVAAVDSDLIARSPVRTRTLGLRPATRPDRPTLTADELLLLADAVGDRFRALILLAGVAGLRWGEAIALRVCDIDLDEHRVRIEQSVEEVAGRVRVVPHLKSEASRRSFTLPPFLVDEVRQHIARHRSDAAQNDLLFIGARGGILRRSFEARRFKPAVVTARLPPTLTFHGLRHVATSFMVACGEHPKVIQYRLGHADPTISIGVYAHVPPTVDRAAADRLDEMIGRGGRAA